MDVGERPTNIGLSALERARDVVAAAEASGLRAAVHDEQLGLGEELHELLLKIRRHEVTPGEHFREMSQLAGRFRVFFEVGKQGPENARADVRHRHLLEFCAQRRGIEHLRALEQTHRSASDERGEQLEEGEGISVADERGQHVRGSEPEALGRRVDELREVSVRGHDPLGRPRRSRGIDDVGWIFEGYRAGWVSPRRQAPPSLRRVEHDHLRSAPSDVDIRGGDDERGRGLREDGLDSRRGMLGVERDMDRAGLHHSEHGHQDIERRSNTYGNPISGDHASLLEQGRKGIRGSIESSMAQGRIFEPPRDGLGSPRCHRAQLSGYRRRREVAPAACLDDGEWTIRQRRDGQGRPKVRRGP